MTERETLIQFPTTFPLKAMGKNAPQFQEIVLDIVRQHVPGDDLESVSSRLSRGDKYISVTVTFIARDRIQLDAIYQKLHDQEQILFAL